MFNGMKLQNEYFEVVIALFCNSLSGVLVIIYLPIK